MGDESPTAAGMRPKLPVAVGFIYNEEVKGHFVSCLAQSINDYDMGFIAAKAGSLLVRGRNNLVQAFMDQTDYEYLWMIDTDMVFPRNMPELLLKRIEGPQKADVVSAMFYGMERDHIFPVLMAKQDDGRYVRIQPPDEQGMMEVDATGMACCLVSRDILQKVYDRHYDDPYHWFREIAPQGQPLGEDVGFCNRVQELGGRIWVDTSLRIGHIKSSVI